MRDDAAADPTLVPHEAPAVYFDGATNRRHAVIIRFGDALDIVEEGASVASWPYKAIRRVDRYPDGLRLLAKGTPQLSRLEVKDADSELLILERCHWINEFDPHLPTILRRIVLPLMAIAAALLAAIFVGLPTIGDEVARKMTDAMDVETESLLAPGLTQEGASCSDPAGLRALDHLTRQLSAASGVAMKPDVTIVANLDDNALTYAGGHIVVYNGILLKSDNPDELAGVIGHEMGHMARRDFVRKLSTLALEPILLGLTFGDVTAAGLATKQTRGLIHGYTGRGIEFRADRFGATLLAKLGRPPTALSSILLKLVDGGKGFEGLYADHPLGTDRAAAIASIPPPPTPGPALLTADEWNDLRAICPHVK